MTGNIIRVVIVITLSICCVIGVPYLLVVSLTEYNKTVNELTGSQTTEQFESQHPTTGEIDEITLFNCKTVFVKNATDPTEECRLDIVTNNSDTLTVNIVHEEDTFKYHGSKISIGDTIEYRVNAAFRLDAIDSINGVAVEHEE